MTLIPGFERSGIAESRTQTYSLRRFPAHNVYTDCPVCVFADLISRWVFVTVLGAFQARSQLTEE